MGERVGRRAVAVAASAALAGGLVTGGGGSGGVARGADLTFNVSLVGTINPNTTGPGTTNNVYADLWADGNLVVLGSVSAGGGGGVTIIDNANPAAPVKRSRYLPIGAANGQFRDVLVRDNVGYFAIDSSLTGTSTVGGIHIVDLANPATPVKRFEINGTQGGFRFNHDLFLDGNFLYIASNQNYQMKVFDVSDPFAPTFVRNIDTSGMPTDFLHDMTIKNGRMYTSNVTNGITDIYDVSNMSTTVAPVKLGSFDVGTRNHSTWPSEDGKLLAVAREDTAGEVQLWNIDDPAAPVVITSIHAAPLGIDSHSAHNPVIIGDTLYVSWYQAGLQIFNIRNPAAPVHLGAYDTFAGGNGNAGSFSGYDGNWGVYPWQGNDKILLSDFDNGFFTVDATNAFRRVWTYDGGPLWWQDHSRWGNGVGGFPNSSEMTAAFTNPAAGASRMVFIEGFVTPSVPRAAGIEFLSTLSYTLQPNGPGEIEMIASNGPAKITVLNGGAGAAGSNRITAPIVLNDDLLVTNNANPATPRALELSVIKATNRTLTFAGAGQTAIVAANAAFTGNLLVNGGNLALRHAQAVNAQPIAVSGGALALRSNASSDFGSDLTVTGAATLTVGNGGAGSGQTHALGDISVASSGALTLVRSDGAHLSAEDVVISGTMAITPQVVGAGGAVATKFETLSMTPGARLDLSDAPLIISSTPRSVIEALVVSGYHFAEWNGPGIVTTQPDALQSLTTLAVATAEQVGRNEFGGLNIDGDDVIVMYTYAGDGNLDGQIDAADYGILDYFVQIAGAFGYANGDFNYDGFIDPADYGAIDNNMQFQGPPLSSASGATSRLGAVPEPSSAIIFIALSTTLGARRRRSRQTTRTAD